MRVVIEPCADELMNLGDIAMLQAAYRRVCELWPGASVNVITGSPVGLREICPGAAPVSADARWLCFGAALGNRFTRHLPPKLAGRTALAGLHVRGSLPALPRTLAVGKAHLHRGMAEMSQFREALDGADLLVVAGAGAINDSFSDLAGAVLAMICDVARQGIPTAMMGQGIGPMDEGPIRARAERVLPSVDLICCREGTMGPRLLAELGVSESDVLVTGDDALEAAYLDEGAPAGQDVGVNVRTAPYAGVSRRWARTLIQEIADDAHRQRRRIVPLPISRWPGEDDAGLFSDDSRPPQTVEETLERIARCRVVITGSYHAGVFALARGIPIIGLVGSRYYSWKFQGLADQFPEGVALVDLQSRGVSERIAAAAAAAWERGPDLAATLQASARDQIANSRAGYQRLKELDRSQRAADDEAPRTVAGED